MLTLSPGPEAQLVELARALDPGRWMLVGGLMVHLHAHLAGVGHQRPTNDVDVVLLPGAGAYVETAGALEKLGYRPHESLDHAAPFHRFVRGNEQVDVMASGDRVRYHGRHVLQVPGAKSAAKRTIVVEIASGRPGFCRLRW